MVLWTMSDRDPQPAHDGRAGIHTFRLVNAEGKGVRKPRA